MSKICPKRKNMRNDSVPWNWVRRELMLKLKQLWVKYIYCYYFQNYNCAKFDALASDLPLVIAFYVLRSCSKYRRTYRKPKPVLDEQCYFIQYKCPCDALGSLCLNNIWRSYSVPRWKPGISPAFSWSAFTGTQKKLFLPNSHSSKKYRVWLFPDQMGVSSFCACVQR